MSAVFCLLSFYGFLKMRQETAKNLWWQTVSVFFFGLALFTKESSVPFLLVFMTADLLYFKGQKWLWHIYPAYLLFILSRLLAGFMVKTPLPIGTASSTYSFVLGTNIIANLVYYLGWLLLPAAIILFSLWIVIKISGFKLDMGKAFPPALSIFGLSFAFINTLIYLPFADYRQLGWMQISTIGMAIFLATPTHYMLDLSFSKKSTRKNLVLAGLILIIFLIVISTLFLPSKLVKRNMQSDYAQAFIKDFAALNIGQEKKVYVIDMGSKEYKLIDTFYSPMAGREVLYESLALFLDKKIPKEVHLVENLSGVKAKGNDVVILYYKEKKILRNAP
jgi:hypothetical protein